MKSFKNTVLKYQIKKSAEKSEKVPIVKNTDKENFDLSKSAKNFDKKESSNIKYKQFK